MNTRNAQLSQSSCCIFTVLSFHDTSGASWIWFMHNIPPPYKNNKKIYELTHFKNFEILIKLSSSTHDSDSHNGLQSIGSKSYFYAYVSKLMFKAKFVNFASFIYLFGQTRNNNRDTLCSWIYAFLFRLNLLHQLVMLGPKQPYHKKHSQEKVGKQSATERQVNYWGA